MTYFEKLSNLWALRAVDDPTKEYFHEGMYRFFSTTPRGIGDWSNENDNSIIEQTFHYVGQRTLSGRETTID